GTAKRVWLSGTVFVAVAIAFVMSAPTMRPVAAECVGCPPPPNEWPQYQHDGQHTGFNAEEKSISTGNVPYLGLRWRSSGVYPISNPVVAAGVLYVPTVISENVVLHALDAVTGTPLWDVSWFGPFYSVSMPAVYEGVIYLAVDRGGYIGVGAVSTTSHQW